MRQWKGVEVVAARFLEPRGRPVKSQMCAVQCSGRPESIEIGSWIDAQDVIDAAGTVTGELAALVTTAKVVREVAHSDGRVTYHIRVSPREDAD